MKPIKNFLPKLVDSLRDFIFLAEEYGCREVKVEPRLTISQVLNQIVAHVDFDFHEEDLQRQGYVYVLELSATSPTGKRLLCERLCFIRIGFEDQDVLDEAEESSACEVRQYLIAEKVMRFITQSLPQVRVSLIAPTGEVMNEGMYQELREYAAVHGITAAGSRKRGVV